MTKELSKVLKQKNNMAMEAFLDKYQPYDLAK